MMRKNPHLIMSILFFALVVMWRMAGAPTNAEQLSYVDDTLLETVRMIPQRMERIWFFWLGNTAEPAVYNVMQEALAETETANQTLLSHENEQMIRVYDHQTGLVNEMPLENYVCGVLAGEMPAAYHMEALKAQAVAARTRAFSQLEAGGCSLHEGCDICTDSRHCQGYASLEECRKLWGNEYIQYRDRIIRAVQDTKGQILTYGGQPITVLYHAISGGQTEDAKTVFASSLPYLVSVESKGEEDVRGYRSDAEYSYHEIAQQLSSVLTDTITKEDVKRELSVLSYTDSGRVDSLQIGAHTISGTLFRKALQLRSTMFTMTKTDTGVIFHQQGYGHGVGMSQAGANCMAADGRKYQEILSHYYVGTEIVIP